MDRSGTELTRTWMWQAVGCELNCRRFPMCASDDRKEKAFTHEAWSKNGRFSQMGV